MATSSPKPFSISFGSNKAKTKPVPLTNPKKRPHSALADERDSDHEEQAQPQLVTGFDHSGAVSATKSPEKAPLIIQAQKNRDWREESRRKRGKNLLPAEVQAARNGVNVADGEAVTERDEVSKNAGLEFVNRDGDADVPMTNGDAPASAKNREPEKERIADEEALEALLGVEKRSNLVISASRPEQNEDAATEEDTGAEEHMNEDARFKADVNSRPESCSLDDYARIPVEDFGKALLRGMGWKEGEEVGKRNEKARAPRVVARRPQLLGLGAKEVPGDIGQELGAWGKAAKGKKKVDLAYSPVLLKNPQTGELLTEDELEKKKLEASKGKGEEDWRERRDKNLAADKERKRDKLAIEDGRNGDYRRRDRSRSKEKQRYKDGSRDGSRGSEQSRHSSSRRDRSRSKERSRHNSSRRDRSRSRDRRWEAYERDDYDRRYRDYDRDRDRRKR